MAKLFKRCGAHNNLVTREKARDKRKQQWPNPTTDTIRRERETFNSVPTEREQEQAQEEGEKPTEIGPGGVSGLGRNGAH